VAAGDAFREGGAEALAGVITRHSRDSELLALALASLTAMSSVNNNSAALLSNGVMASVVAALSGYLAAADLPPLEANVAGGLVPAATGAYAAGGPDAEAVGVVEAFLGLAAQALGAAYTDAATLGDGGVCALLVRTLPGGLPTPLALRRAYSALEALAKTGAGAARVLAQPEALDKLLLGASTVYAAPRPGGGGGGGGGGAPGAARAPARSTRELLLSKKRSFAALDGAFAPPAVGAGAGAAGGGAGDAAALNAHLEPAFRLLHKLSLTREGLAALREPGRDTVAVLAPAVDWAQSGAPGDGGALGGLGVRLLSRVLGEDLGRLIESVAAACAPGAPPAAAAEGDFAAALLASLARDGGAASRLVQGGLAPKLEALLEAPSLSARAAASLATAARRLAAHGADALAAVREANAAARLMGAVRRVVGDARASPLPTHARAVAVEGLCALGDVMVCGEDVSAADGAGGGGGGGGRGVGACAAGRGGRRGRWARLRGAALFVCGVRARRRGRDWRRGGGRAGSRGAGRAHRAARRRARGAAGARRAGAAGGGERARRAQRGRRARAA
jgi:hypothetical protein